MEAPEQGSRWRLTSHPSAAIRGQLPPEVPQPQWTSRHYRHLARGQQDIPVRKLVLAQAEFQPVRRIIHVDASPSARKPVESLPSCRPSGLLRTGRIQPYPDQCGPIEQIGTPSEGRQVWRGDRRAQVLLPDAWESRTEGRKRTRRTDPFDQSHGAQSGGGPHHSETCNQPPGSPGEMHRSRPAEKSVAKQFRCNK